MVKFCRFLNTFNVKLYTNIFFCKLRVELDSISITNYNIKVGLYCFSQMVTNVWNCATLHHGSLYHPKATLANSDKGQTHN